MKNLNKDIKSHRPILIQPAQAAEYLDRVAQVDVPLNAKASDVEEFMAMVFGKVETLEKFPPYAVIPVKGVIGKNLSELETMCGCCDINDVQEMLEDCERDATITTVILNIDSPGGVSVGVPELAEKIKNYSKKVISFTSNEACSAAYWIGSQASEFYATPSSTVGSIGVYVAFPDMSEAFKMDGIKMDVIKAGIYKGAGIPGTSLDNNQRKMLQDEVLEIHADFKNAVKSVRSFVDDASMEGQCFSGKRGAEAGLVTGLVNGFDELMESLDANVHAQMEADEENDAREEESEEGEEEEYDNSKTRYVHAKITAAERALLGVNLKKADDKMDSEEEEGEDEKGYPAQPEDRKITPKMEDAEDKKSEDSEGDADEKCEEESEEGENCPKCGKPHDKPDAEDAKAEDAEEDKCDPDDPDYDPEDPDCDPEEKASEESKKMADDQADSGKRPIDTDEKHDRSGTNRHR
jgi:signal peptide peptidase SppA